MIMKNKVPVRQVRDLDNAVRKVAEMFETDAVVVVGSQAVLMKWGDRAPDAMRTTAEIDMYPANKRIWEAAEKRKAGGGQDYVEASEYIHSIAGEGSAFDQIYGFYVDGVDENTSPLPRGWQERAMYREVKTKDGHTVTAVSPSIEDTIAAKMIRLRQKDREFVQAGYDFRAFDIERMKELMASIQPHGSYSGEYLDAARAKAFAFLDGLEKKKPSTDQTDDLRKSLAKVMPDYPSDTHCAFYNIADGSVSIRKWDSEMGIYYKIDNPLGPAVVSKRFAYHVLDGVKMDEDTWSTRINEGVEAPSPPPWKM